MPSEAPSLLNKLFSRAIELKASDIHLAVNNPPVYRVNKVLKRDEGEVLTQKVLLAEFKIILTPEVYASFERHQDIDTSFALPHGERFRISLFWKSREPALAARYIPATIPTLDELEAPEAVLDFVKLPQGIVLVTGPTGAGKSTLLASMIEYINQNETKHIVTLEDPIEFVYADKQSFVSQRELGSDFMSFADGLKHLFRQDPDIILIGEMRDPETIATALTLAETGHLVFATLHTNGAAQTVERIINTFPGNQQTQIRLQLSLVLKGVISQLLIPSVDGMLTPVHEVMVMNHAVSTIVREGHTEQLQNVIFSSSDAHMVDLDQELQLLVEEKKVSPETAHEFARNPKNFK